MRAVDRVAIGEAVGSCSTAAWRGQTVIVREIATDPLWADFAGLAASHGLVACWSWPIFSREGRVLGTFALYPDRALEPDALTFEQVAIATHLAAIAIARHREENALRESEGAFPSVFEWRRCPEFCSCRRQRVGDGTAASSRPSATPARRGADGPRLAASRLSRPRHRQQGGGAALKPARAGKRQRRIEPVEREVTCRNGERRTMLVSGCAGGRQLPDDLLRHHRDAPARCPAGLEDG